MEIILMVISKSWYMRWWGMTIIFFFVLFLALALVFLLYIAKLVSGIKAVKVAPTGFSSATNIPKPTGAKVNSQIATTDDPSIGPKNAKVTVVEFSDFQCPYCGEAFPVIRELEVLYKDKVRFIYRDFPIVSIHDFALGAALAADCANEQGKFWAYHDKLFTHQENLDISSLKQYALQVGLDAVKFNKCLDTSKYQSEVESDFNDGVAAGVTGTPTWFIDGKKVEGVLSLDVFK